MSVFDFETYMEQEKEELEHRLYWDAEGFRVTTFILNSLKPCTNRFEEETLIENLVEVYRDYLKRVA